jgi:hypothetical protein
MNTMNYYILINLKGDMDMADDRQCGCGGIGFGGGCEWIWWIIIILVIVCLFCPGIFGC